MNPYDPAPRTVAIIARTAHLLAMAGYLGGRMAGHPTAASRWRTATTLTGAALLATEASHSRHWAYEGRGLLVFAHVGVLVAFHRAKGAEVPVAVAALVIGAVGSHLPKSLRKWSLRHRRIVSDEGPGRDRRPGRGEAGPGEAGPGEAGPHGARPVA